ncbi:MAG: hypothetical protein JST80_12585 [Bdellovibrionales bacterium]|nr:hypothetical protein [Bdellovibrionales bacterium]
MSDDSDKKDLTGIHAVPPAPSAPGTGTFANPPTETVDSFESIMPDMSLPDPTTSTQAPSVTNDTAKPDDFETQFESSEPTAAEKTDAADPVMDEIRNYSHSVQGTSQLVDIFVPYHLYLSGTFGPYERDKLLLFITENEIGVGSQDLDLQIRSGKVFFPRISEFAGVKIIQELRDSGLKFKFVPSDRDRDEPVQQGEALEYHYQSPVTPLPTLMPIPVIGDDSKQLADYTELEVISLNQYLKAEIVEAEKSDLFQEIIDRMVESLKQKARIKGGHALCRLQQKISPLRLPSQYQVLVQATALKKKI